MGAQMTPTGKELSESEVRRVFRDLGLATGEQRRELLRSLSAIEPAQPTESDYAIRLSGGSEPTYSEKDE